MQRTGRVAQPGSACQGLKLGVLPQIIRAARAWDPDSNTSRDSDGGRAGPGPHGVAGLTLQVPGPAQPTGRLSRGAGASELAVAGAVTVASSEGFELGRPGVARETCRDRDFRVK